MSRLPSLFIGHGSPMNAIARNTFTQAWERLGREIPRPRVVLCISAHWYTEGTAVTAMEQPRTIHDFRGFPRELAEFQYPAPGNPGFARELQAHLKPIDVQLNEAWGLDHGAWSVLCHVYPRADVPVVQLSIDANHPSDWHYALGQRLAPLRDEGVLIVATGNVVHNLRYYGRGPQGDPLDWAARFDAMARQWILAGDHQPLIRYETQGRDAELAAPDRDHFLPLLYVLGTQQPDERASIPVEGFDGSSISMMSVKVG